MQSFVREEVEDEKSQEPNQKPEIEDDEVEEDEPNVEPEQEDDLEVHTDNQEDNTSSSKQKSAKAIQSPKKLALDHYREWEKAFKFINLKRPSKNRYELDEEKTVENIASTKVFDLVFKRVEEKSFFLTLVIDQGETMELWTELIRNFEQMLMTMGVFSRISIYYWDTKKEKPILYVDKALKREVSEKLVVIDGKRNLVWVMSDCIAPAWKSGKAFKSIERWTIKSFTSILQMFPKEMWMGTMLFKGKHIRLSSNSFNPINKKLQIKSSKKKNTALKIPIISFDPYALQAWAKVVVNSKENSISGIELENLDFEPLKTPLKKDITTEMRMQRFYSQASPTAQKLAFYMSVLPVDFQVTRILQEERLPKSNQAHVAEVFLGGLIERRKKSKDIHYDFYPKVREELNANISADESFEIMADMSNFVSNHLGIGFDFKALLADPNGVFEGDFSLHDESLAYAKLASKVLKRKGGELYTIAKKIDTKVNEIELESFPKNYEEQVIDKLSNTFIEELVNYEIDDESLTYDGRVATISQLDQAQNIELLNIKKIENDNYYIDVNFNIDSYIEVVNYSDKTFPNTEKEYLLSVDCIILVEFKKLNLYELKIETILDVTIKRQLLKEIILYKEDNLDIDLVEIVNYLNTICNYIIFKIGKYDFQLNSIIDASLSYDKINYQIDEESIDSLRTIIFTEKPYNNNYFFEPNINRDDNLRIVSFSNWNSLTTLPKNNGLVYFVAWLLALTSEKFDRHYESNECIYNFSGIKTDIDNNMRNAYICQNCLDITVDYFSDSRILDDLIKIMDFVGKASKYDLDVLDKSNEVIQTVWIIAPGEEARIWNDCRDEGYIAIGWDKIDVNKYTSLSTSKDQLKKDLIFTYGEKYNTRKHNFLWNFGKVMKIGDIVIARNGRSIIVGIGKIVSDYIAPNDVNNPRINKEYKQIRRVEWWDIKEHSIENGLFPINTVFKTTSENKMISDILKKVLTSLTEYEIMKSVLLQLERNNWIETNIIREYKLPNRGRADILLKYENKNLAVIEVKSPKSEPKAGLEQAIYYGKLLNLDYVYATNGLAIYEYSLKNEIGKYIDEYPSPDKLLQKYNVLNQQLKEDILETIPYINNNLKRHHKEAISAIIEEIINRNKRILLSLVTGVGKSVILLEVIHKLYKSNLYEGRKPRVLFLSDRKMLVHQSMNIMKELGGVYEVSGKNKVIDYNQNLFFATIQLMQRKEISLEKNFFDMIVIDSIPLNMENLEYILNNNLNAIQIGFSQKSSKKIKEYFGEVIYKYSYQDAINDNTVEPFRLERIEDTDLLNSNTPLLLERISLTILNMITSDEKVVIVCDSIAEMRAISDVINEFNNITDEEICFNISTFSSSKERDEIQKKLHDDTMPFVLTVTKEFLIGIDIGNVRKLVLGTRNISIDKLQNIIHKFTNNSRVKDLVVIDFFNHINQENFDFTHEQTSFLSDTWDFNEDVLTRKIINKLTMHVEKNNKQEVANLIEYPLKRFGFIPDIKDKEDFIKRYSQIFDEKLISMLLSASDKDWSEVGYKGTMFNNGLIWINEGKIIAINYTSEEEKKLQKKLKRQDKNLIYILLKDYKENKLIWITENYKIRIDELTDSSYRCAIWKKEESQAKKPSMIFWNGEVTYEGNQGYHYYTFLFKEQKYIISVNALKNDILGELSIYENNKLLIEEKVLFQVDNITNDKFDRKYKLSKLRDVMIENLEKTWKDFDTELKDPFDMKQKEKENLEKLRKSKKKR